MTPQEIAILLLEANIAGKETRKRLFENQGIHSEKQFEAYALGAEIKILEAYLKKLKNSTATVGDLP